MQLSPPFAHATSLPLRSGIAALAVCTGILTGACQPVPKAQVTTKENLSPSTEATADASPSSRDPQRESENGSQEDDAGLEDKKKGSGADKKKSDGSDPSDKTKKGPVASSRAPFAVATATPQGIESEDEIEIDDPTEPTATPEPTPTPTVDPKVRIEQELEAALERSTTQPRRESDAEPEPESKSGSAAMSEVAKSEAESAADPVVDETVVEAGTNMSSEPSTSLRRFVMSTASTDEELKNAPATLAVWTPSGHLLPATPNDDDTWTVLTPCGEETILDDVRLAERPQVLLDPGHGGDEPGTSTEGGLAEKDLNLRVARLVRDRLNEAGISVLMVREDDVRITVRMRSEIANAVQPELFVSIHHNGGVASSSNEPPVEVFHQRNERESKRLAGLLYERLDRQLSGFDYEWPANSFAGAQPRFNGEGEDLYGVLRRTNVPAVLSEAFYLDGDFGDTVAANSKAIEAEADAIADAVIAYFDTDDAGSGFVKGREFKLTAPNSGGNAGCVDPDLAKP